MFVQAFLCLIIYASLTTVQCEQRTDNLFWTNLAKNELEEALKVKWNQNVAKNVILFIGDGMGPNTVTATRIYKGGETNRLIYEQFPHVGLLKTYSANKMVPDSASTATALLCGVKANQETVGVDATVKLRNCQHSLLPSTRLTSLSALALKAGKSTGLVTTMRVTHATPGPIYAHSADRKWESDSVMPDNAKDCKDIGRQLVEDWPGRDLHVIMGGGRQVLVYNVTETIDDPIDSWAGIRKDGKNLINHYKKDKEERKLKYAVVSNNQELENLDSTKTDYVLGIFANSHLKYEHERNKGLLGMPSITDMVKAAINILKKNSKGYFLMVEGGNIDFAHHRGRAKVAINEAAAMEDAVRAVVDMTNEEDTLLIVTSDHTHTLSINGYPFRGTNIFGLAPQASDDGSNYTTLTYGTGGPTSYHYYVKEGPDGNNSVGRQDPSLVDTNSFDYHQLAAIRLAENSHGGGDVAVYARDEIPIVILEEGVESDELNNEILGLLGADPSHKVIFGDNLHKEVASSSQIQYNNYKREGVATGSRRRRCRFESIPSTRAADVVVAAPANTSIQSATSAEALHLDAQHPLQADLTLMGREAMREAWLRQGTPQVALVIMTASLSESTFNEYNCAIKLWWQFCQPKGPFSHLFHNVHEQHYVYHAISYAAKLGDYSASRSESMILKKYVTILSIAACIISYRLLR